MSDITLKEELMGRQQRASFVNNLVEDIYYHISEDKSVIELRLGEAAAQGDGQYDRQYSTPVGDSNPPPTRTELAEMAGLVEDRLKGSLKGWPDVGVSLKDGPCKTVITTVVFDWGDSEV